MDRGKSSITIPRIEDGGPGEAENRAFADV